MDSIKIRLNNRVIGEVKDSVFQKHVRNRHILTRPPAIAYDVEVLDRARQAGATSLLVLVEDGTRYSISFSDFDRHSFFINRGYGSQRAVRLQYWQVNDSKRDAGVQLALWSPRG